MKFTLLLAVLSFSISVHAQISRPLTDFFALARKDNAGKTSAQVNKESLDNYARFVAMDVNSPAHSPYSVLDANQPKSLTKNNATFVLMQAESNRVVSLNSYLKYDAENKGIGFCFGRAMFVNLYLAQAGFNRANMKKAFVIGSMSNRAWGWHVTTIVQSTHAGKEIWLAIDPVARQVMEVKAWYKHWQGSSDDGMLRLYIADSGKLGAGSSRYDEEAIRNPFYNNYFNDMMAWFHENDIQNAIKF